jgi:hypothetical protein
LPPEVCSYQNSAGQIEHQHQHGPQLPLQHLRKTSRQYQVRSRRQNVPPSSDFLAHRIFLNTQRPVRLKKRMFMLCKLKLKKSNLPSIKRGTAREKF